MNNNSFKKYLLPQMVCLIIIFGIAVYYCYQQPVPGLAEQESILKSRLIEAGYNDIDLKYKSENVDNVSSLDFHTLEKKFETGVVRINIVEDRLAHSVFSFRRQLRTVVVENSVDKSDLANATLFVKTVLKIGEAVAPRQTNLVFTDGTKYHFANYPVD